MDKLKSHITIYLAMLFLVAQGMGTLHFFTIHHEFDGHSADGSPMANTSQVNHNCDFKFFKNPVVSPVIYFKEEKYVPVFARENQFVYNEPLKKRPKNDRYLRGPPLFVG